MSTTVRVRVVGQRLEPAGAADAELIEAMGGAGEVTARLTRSRSLPHQRWYWACLHRLVASTALGDHYPSAEHLHRALLYETGHTTPIHVPGLGDILAPDSTRFDAMDQVTFRTYTDAASRVLAEHFGLALEEAEDAV